MGQLDSMVEVVEGEETDTEGIETEKRIKELRKHGTSARIHLCNKSVLREIVQNAREQGENTWVALEDKTGITKAFIKLIIQMTPEEIATLPTLHRWDAEAIRELIVERESELSAYDLSQIDPQLGDYHKYWRSVIETMVTRESKYPERPWHKGWDPVKHRYDGGDREPGELDPVRERFWVFPVSLVRTGDWRTLLWNRGLWRLFKDKRIPNPSGLRFRCVMHLREHGEVLHQELLRRKAEPWLSQQLGYTRQLFDRVNTSKPLVNDQKIWTRWATKWLAKEGLVAYPETVQQYRLMRRRMAKKAQWREKVPVGIAVLPSHVTEELEHPLNKVVVNQWVRGWGVQVMCEAEPLGIRD